MLPVGGKPLLAHTIIWLRSSGVREIGINLHYMPDAILEHFGSGESLGVAITYSVEEALLGTAGALHGFDAFLDESFVVVYGDVLTNMNLRALASLHNGESRQEDAASLATLSLYQVPNPTECGLIELDEASRVISFVEKPKPEDVRTNLAFSGVMICEPEILSQVADGGSSDFGFDVFPKLLAEAKPFYGHTLSSGEYVIDIGTMPGYLRALRLQWE